MYSCVKFVLMCLVVLMLAAHSQAAPELKGTPDELTGYLSSLPNEVTLVGEAKVTVQTEKGVVTIGVRTENPELFKALQNSQKLRNKIATQLVQSGIAKERIKGTRFSSTPEYGIFGKKPSNYVVDNLIQITIEHEAELQEVAKLVDSNEDVYYQGLELKDQEKEDIKQQILDQALADVLKRKKVYEARLGLSLKPLSFNENVSVQPAPPRPQVVSKSSYSSVQSGPRYEAALSLGEQIYRGSVSVKYLVIE